MHTYQGVNATLTMQRYIPKAHSLLLPNFIDRTFLGSDEPNFVLHLTDSAGTCEGPITLLNNEQSITFDTSLAAGSAIQQSGNIFVLNPHWFSDPTIDDSTTPIKFYESMILTPDKNQFSLGDSSKVFVSDGSSSFDVGDVTISEVLVNNKSVSFSYQSPMLTVDAPQGSVIEVKIAVSYPSMTLEVATNDVDYNAEAFVFVKSFTFKESEKYKELDGLEKKKIPLRTTVSGSVKKAIDDQDEPLDMIGKWRIATDLGDYALYVLNCQIDSTDYNEPEIETITKGFNFSAEKVIKEVF